MSRASEVLRQAIATRVEHEEASLSCNPYETIADLVGSVRGDDRLRGQLEAAAVSPRRSVAA
jgi:hypothetical protein